VSAVNQIALVAVGGGCGAVLRFLLGGSVTAAFGRTFPFATLSVNVIGALAIGVLYIALSDRLPHAQAWRLLLMTGLLGGFTTFSAFSLETLQLIEAGDLARAVLYVVASVALCLLSCWAGMSLGRQF
jgi:fluoride exporter